MKITKVQRPESAKYRKKYLDLEASDEEKKSEDDDSSFNAKAFINRAKSSAFGLMSPKKLKAKQNSNEITRDQTNDLLFKEKSNEDDGFPSGDSSIKKRLQKSATK